MGDFGLAALHAPGDLCATHVGTRSYQAPEVLGGGGAYDGAKADAWSLGVVLFILLLGAPPFAQVSPCHATTQPLSLGHNQFLYLHSLLAASHPRLKCFN